MASVLNCTSPFVFVRTVAPLAFGGLSQLALRDREHTVRIPHVSYPGQLRRQKEPHSGQPTIVTGLPVKIKPQCPESVQDEALIGFPCALHDFAVQLCELGLVGPVRHESVARSKPQLVANSDHQCGAWRGLRNTKRWSRGCQHGFVEGKGVLVASAISLAMLFGQIARTFKEWLRYIKFGSRM